MSAASTIQRKEQAGKILVVDDEPIVCKRCLRVLTPEGYSVSVTHSGDEGIEKGASGDFDVVIVDLKMPDVDGMQVLRAIKENQPDVEVIMTFLGDEAAADRVEYSRGEILHLEQKLFPHPLK